LDFFYPPDRELPTGAGTKARACKIIAIRKRSDIGAF
jgi:hypothetical protein